MNRTRKSVFVGAFFWRCSNIRECVCAVSGPHCCKREAILSHAGCMCVPSFGVVCFCSRFQRSEEGLNKRKRSQRRKTVQRSRHTPCAVQSGTLRSHFFKRKALQGHARLPLRVSASASSSLHADPSPPLRRARRSSTPILEIVDLRSQFPELCLERRRIRLERGGGERASAVPVVEVWCGIENF